MKRLTAVILVLLVGVAALVGCAKKGPTETIDQPQDALALLVESKDSETGITIYINQRSDLLTGAYFYPYIEKGR
jgi:predicted small lipoprotein YifL